MQRLNTIPIAPAELEYDEILEKIGRLILCSKTK